MKNSRQEPLLQSIKPCRAADALKLWARENRFQFAAIAGEIGSRFLEAVEVGAQTLQASADGSGVGSAILLVIPPNVPPQAFGSDVEFPLISVYVPALRQIAQGLGR